MSNIHGKTEILRIGDEHIEKEYIIVVADGNYVKFCVGLNKTVAFHLHAEKC